MNESQSLTPASRNWAETLYKELAALTMPSSLEEALAPLVASADEWNAASFDSQMQLFDEGFEDLLDDLRVKYGDSSILGYSKEFARALHANTLQEPPLYRICSSRMFSPERRTADGRPSDSVRSVLPFYKLLSAALFHLPSCFRHQGKAFRGVKWVYPSPEDHRPEAHFQNGRKVVWFEPKSSSRCFDVMYKEHFCGQKGPRTIFTVRAPTLTGFSIEDFSAFGPEEQEVLFPPLSVFEIDESQKRWYKRSDPNEKEGYPDDILLKQLANDRWNVGQLFTGAAPLAPQLAAPSQAHASGGSGYAGGAGGAPAGEVIQTAVQEAKKESIAASHLLCGAGYAGFGPCLLHLAAIMKESKPSKKDIKNSQRMTPMLLAAAEGDWEVVGALADAGADKELKDEAFGRTALHWAARKGHAHALKELLDRGAEKDVQNQDGYTALILAAANNHPECVQLLLNDGAKKDVQSKLGFTALMGAVQENHPECAQLLLNDGAKKDVQNQEGATALMLAANNNHPECVQLLLKNGAKKDVQRKDGWTALMAAAQHNHPECVQLLSKNGADKGVKNNYGRTALDVATWKGHEECRRLLR